jgi:hypothetical protein
METHVLAVAAHGLEQPDADIRLAQELMLWRLSRTMMRNCKVIYRLHDLPLNARILSGLAYLMTLATGGSVEPDLGSTKQPLALDHDVLAQWLGVPLKLLKARLLRLERIGLLNCDDDAIRSIDLFTLAQLAPPLATG